MQRPKAKRTFENLRYGIEIEVEFDKPNLSQKLIDRHRIIRGWDIDFDGSLDEGCEYRPKNKNKLYYNEESIYQIKEIIGLIKAHRGHIKGSTCGTHIHVDMKLFNNREICNIIKAYIRQQTTICKEFNMLKCRLDYAQKIPKNVIKYLTESNIQKIKDNEMENDNLCEYLTERHFQCNAQSLYKHNSLEFRLFNGSIQIRTIKKYIKFALNFCLDNAKGK